MLNHLVMDRLSLTAEAIPEHQALVCGDARLNFRSVEEQSNALSHFLIDLGVKRGDRVAVSLAKCNEYVIAQYAILKCGACYVPIDVDYPLHRKLQIIEEAEIEVLFASADTYSELIKQPSDAMTIKHLIALDDISAIQTMDKINLHRFGSLDSFPTSRQLKQRPIENDLAYIMYTSGSTGKPKGVMLTQGNIKAYCEWFQSVYALRKDDKTVNVAPFTFDISGTEIFSMATSGATMLIVPDQKRITTILSTIEKEKATFISTVPTVIGTMVNNPRVFSRYDLSSLRYFVSGAAVCPPSFMKKLHEHLPNAILHNQYGPTEATIYCLFHEINPQELKEDVPLPIGKPYENMDAYIVQEDGKEAPRGEKGELILRGPQLACGYFKNEEKTKEAFRSYTLAPHLNEIVYHTGDIAYQDNDGVFHFRGRKDDMIKSRGYRIELNEIDLALSTLEGKFVEFAAVALPDELIENKIVAAVVLENGIELTEAQIKEHCANKIPDYMVPDSIIFMDALPHTSSGKISKKDIIKSLSKQ